MKGFASFVPPPNTNRVLSWYDLLVAVLRNHHGQTSPSNEEDPVTGCTEWFSDGRCLHAVSPKGCYHTSSLQIKM